MSRQALKNLNYESTDVDSMYMDSLYSAPAIYSEPALYSEPEVGLTTNPNYESADVDTLYSKSAIYSEPAAG